jgi:hypothetical protein
MRLCVSDVSNYRLRQQQQLTAHSDVVFVDSKRQHESDFLIITRPTPWMPSGISI